MLENDLLTKVRSLVKSCLPQGGPLVVAVSGGADSVCLLYVLERLKEELRLDLHVAHLNHGLRGEESDADGQFVTDMAGRLNLPYSIDKRNIDVYGETTSIEEKARYMRYSFLSEVAQSCGAEAVALGHTAEDQVETILMHLVRGSGLAGLSGMKQVSTWRPSAGLKGITIIRPLLEVSRTAIERYCSDNDLSYVTDSSNRSPVFLRNRFRHELVPLLKGYNAGFEDALLRLARLVSDEIDMLDEQVSLAWERVVTEGDDSLVIGRTAFNSLPAAVQRHFMRVVLKSLLGDLFDIESVHIDNMCEMMDKKVGKQLTLPFDLIMVNGYVSCTVGRRGYLEEPVKLDGEYLLKIPGVTVIPGWKITAKIEGKRIQNESNYHECFDYDVIAGQLKVRAKNPGDSFRPLGMKGSKSIKDFMIDLKIPKAQRNSIPIVCSNEQIIWVVGYRIDERVKVTTSTKSYLSARFERTHIDSV